MEIYVHTICFTTNKFLINRFYGTFQQIQQFHPLLLMAVNIVKIKTAGSGGTNGSHTSVAIRGDGSSGKATVTISGGVVTAVTVTTAGTGYTFDYTLELLILIQQVVVLYQVQS